MKRLRRYSMLRLLLALGLCLALAPSLSAADAGVILRASIEPQAGIWVGQQVRLLIDVLARDGWAQIRKFHPFEVPGASVLQVESQGTRLTDTVSGAPWTGQHYKWLVFPQRAGTIPIPPIVMDVETKDLATQEATLVPDQKTPMVVFQAGLPPGADQERGLISTTRLEAGQTLASAVSPLRRAPVTCTAPSTPCCASSTGWKPVRPRRNWGISRSAMATRLCGTRRSNWSVSWPPGARKYGTPRRSCVA